MLKPEDILALDSMLRSRFNFAEDAEISVEMDPNDLDVTAPKSPLSGEPRGAIATPPRAKVKSVHQ